MFSSSSAHAAHRSHYESRPKTKTQDKMVGHKDKSFPPFPLLSAEKKYQVVWTINLQEVVHYINTNYEATIKKTIWEFCKGKLFPPHHLSSVKPLHTMPGGQSFAM